MFHACTISVRAAKNNTRVSYTKMAEFVKTHKQPYEALQSFVEKQPLKGKKVLVTGAGRGVGFHITQGLAEAGAAEIGILGKNAERIRQAKADLETLFPKTSFIEFSADITDEAAIEKVFESFGVPDILVNNAGHFPDEGPFVKSTIESWFSGFTVNVMGTANVTQKFLRAKPEGREAVVLIVSSMAAHMRFPLIGWSGYNSSKLGQARMFENLRFEHPEVRFINIHPGQIESDGFTRSGASAPPSGMTDGSLAGLFFAWAASDEAAFLSGRFAWAEWDITELEKRKQEIVDKDLLLTTIDGFNKGFF